MIGAYILSGQYITSELQLEFGKILPTELPLNNISLYNHQKLFLQNFTEEIFVTIPKDYEDSLPKNTNKIVTTVNCGLLDVFKSIKKHAEIREFTRVIILYGDTLINASLSLDENQLIVSKPQVNYSQWHYYNDGTVFTGLSSLDLLTLTSALETATSIGDFLNTLWGQVKSVMVNDWLDFGYYTSFYVSKQRYLESRSFNTIYVEDSVMTKKSSQIEKMFCEYKWMDTMSRHFPFTVPKPIDFVCTDDTAQYSLEYYSLPSLAEIFVFGRISQKNWKRILSKIKNFKTRLESCGPIVRQSGFYSSKLNSRKDAVLEILGEEPVYFQFAQDQIKIALILDEYDNTMVWSHGDLCFSNILFDARRELIKVIDPRGKNELSEGFNPMMPALYDYFKLAHSYVSGYDSVIAGLELPKAYQIEFNLELCSELFEVNRNILNAGLSHLFFTMIPLHKDRIDRIEKFYSLSKSHYDSIDFSGI